MSDIEDSSFDSEFMDEFYEDEPMPTFEKKKMSDNASTKATSVTSTNSNTSRNVEDVYQKMTQLEHILARPDTYIGSIEKSTQEMWVYDSTQEKLVYKNITFVAGLYKIFDEILVNAADNKQRDKSMNLLKVNINRETKEISVYNNGKGIPVVIHKTYNCYVPSLIFGQLLTSSNYNDKEKKVTGGRNGYGAKLTNIYSTTFTVETVDMEQKLKFVQTWHNNMQECSDPIITPVKSNVKSDYTLIKFIPDLQRFNMTDLDEDTISLMEKRVFDMAGTTDSTVKVYLNDKQIPINNFQSYIKMYQYGPEANPLIYTKAGERWEIAVGQSDGHFQQVSFVNAICTTKGGTHVQYICDKVVAYLQTALKRKNKKDIPIKPQIIKNYLYIACNCLIENPSFDSQTKETLTTKRPAFGSYPEITDTFLQKVSKCGIIESILSFAKFKDDNALKKKGGTKIAKLKGIDKLDDANNAGTRYSQKCSLIITEGDSAKALAIAGLSIVGRDNYGVFPLRGKLLNVRDLSSSAINKNEEIVNLIKILGLKFGMEYTDTSSLRYGSLIIMADQDHDGSHIKGLVVNFIHRFWPSLLKIPFLKQFITPIVKVTKKTHQEMFFTIPEYKQWLEENNMGKGWTIKYYKGLGTSTSKEGKEYFSNLERHIIPFQAIDDSDGELIDMAFRKDRVMDRKDWINSYVQNTYVDYAVDEMAYKDFINKELILYSKEDNIRSIPSVVDGFKPSQRKVLFGCFKRKLKNEIKVIQLAGYISEHAAYHHGEASLTQTIVNMAQDFVGSNNLNLLVPAGQFGTRLLGGKDAASARYIYTYLSKITRAIFKEADDHLLNYLDDDGQSIEPDYYLPILPFVLVNGSDGIGTGWSTNIPCYNPISISQWIRARIHGTELPTLHPWWYGFTGEIIQKGTSGYLVRGHYREVDNNTIIIDELPIYRWTQDYKKMLNEYMDTEKHKQPLIVDFLENHTESRVHFTIRMTDEQMKNAREDMYKYFKLETSVSTNNFVLFDQLSHLNKYNSVDEILEEFYAFRLPFFQKRKDYLISQLQDDLIILKNKVRFILAVVNNELVINKRKRKELFQILVRENYDMIFPKSKKEVVVGDIDHTNDEEQDINRTIDEYTHENPEDSIYEEEEDKKQDLSLERCEKGYDYLLNMPLWSLTLERVELLKKQLEEKEQEITVLLNTEPTTMWLQDLDEFERVVKVIEKEREEDRRLEKKAREKHEKSLQATKERGAALRSRKAHLEDSLVLSESSDDDYHTTSKRKGTKRKAPKASESVEYAPIPSFFDPVPVPPYIPDKVPRAKKEPGTEEKKKRGRPRTTVKKEEPETPQQGTTPVEESMDEDVNMSKVFEDEAEDAFDDDSEENSFVNEEMEEKMNQQEVKSQPVKEGKPVVEEEPKPKRKSTKKNVTLDQLFNTVPALTTTTTEEPPKTEKKKRTYTRRTKATTTEDEEEKPKTRKAATTPTEPATTAPAATEPPAATPAKDEIIVLDDEDDMIPLSERLKNRGKNMDLLTSVKPTLPALTRSRRSKKRVMDDSDEDYVAKSSK